MRTRAATPSLFAEQPQQEVFGPDIGVVEKPRLFHRILEGLLAPGGRGRSPLSTRSRSDLQDRFDLDANPVAISTEVLENVRADPRTFFQETQENVFGADVLMLEPLRFLVGQLQHLSRTVCEAFVHGRLSVEPGKWGSPLVNTRLLARRDSRIRPLTLSDRARLRPSLLLHTTKSGFPGWESGETERPSSVFQFLSDWMSHPIARGLSWIRPMKPLRRPLRILLLGGCVLLALALLTTGAVAADAAARQIGCGQIVDRQGDCETGPGDAGKLNTSQTIARKLTV